MQFDNVNQKQLILFDRGKYVYEGRGKTNIGLFY